MGWNEKKIYANKMSNVIIALGEQYSDNLNRGSIQGKCFLFSLGSLQLDFRSGRDGGYIRKEGEATMHHFLLTYHHLFPLYCHHHTTICFIKRWLLTKCWLPSSPNGFHSNHFQPIHVPRRKPNQGQKFSLFQIMLVKTQWQENG